ncbi:MAG: hypothetical protein ACOYEV_15540 [Candidatus Nanopelagicales bacterium]
MGAAKGPVSRPPARRARGCGLTVVALLGASLLVGVYFFLRGAVSILEGSAAPDPGMSKIGAVEQPPAASFGGSQPAYGVDISFPQCGRSFQDLPDGFVIVGLDGGMPGRDNECFTTQWAFATRQPGAAIYVNTSDPGTGDATRWGQEMAQGDLERIAALGIPGDTPVWLDVELTEVWRGSHARHREVITAHLRTLAAAGHPVGVYSAPNLWAEITGDADLGVPTWLGIGKATAERAAAACTRESFGGRKPSLVQRIGTATDGLSLDRNTVCPGISLDGLVRPFTN